MAGKGSHQRPRFISDEEWALKYDLAHGRIQRAEFDKKMAELKKEKEAKRRKALSADSKHWPRDEKGRWISGPCISH